MVWRDRGVIGVALLSWNEVVTAHAGAGAGFGIVLAFCAIFMASISNLIAHKGEQLKAPVTGLIAWAMVYGASALALLVMLSGRVWSFSATPVYIASLFYLAIMGSVVAFLLYFSLARRRGYGLAGYVTALAPLVAMTVSAIAEHKHWTIAAYAAAAVVVAGQALLLGAKRT